MDQEITLWKRQWAQCLLEERPDSLGAALQQCDEERFPNIFCLLKVGCTLPIASPVKGVSTHCARLSS